MISTILSLSFKSSTATSAETSGIRPVRQLIDVVGFPCQLADGVRILPVQPGMTSAETTACRTYSLIRNPASPARFLMA